MGFYTEIFIKLQLKKDTPQHVVDICRMLFEGTPKEKYERKQQMPDFPDHPFFECQRWDYIGTLTQSYDPVTCMRQVMAYTDEGDENTLVPTGEWEIVSLNELKDYGNEIELFFNWIAPYAVPMNGFVGYAMTEEQDIPSRFFYVTHKKGEATQSVHVLNVPQPTENLPRI